jgi:glycosyltransferase involved in cell wall biosynthesis
LVITFLIRSLGYGGSERQLVALAKGLHEHRHSVMVAVFYSGGPLEKKLLEAGVTVQGLDKRGRWDLFGFLLRLVRILYEEKPDILHGYLGTPNILTVLLKPIFPHVRMVWGVRASNVDLNRYDWLSRLSYKVERRLSRFADLIIANSRSGLDYAVASGFPKNKMVVIPNGIDTDRFCPDPKARQRIRAEWGVTESEKLIGLVGRFDPMKDHPTFLRAAALLAQERENVRFVCVGDGPAGYRRELRALGEDLGLTRRLIWAGVRADMPAVYNALDIATSSSAYGEGFPNAVGEAMSCGVPCVVTDVGDSAWIVKETGRVVPPGDPEKLTLGWADVINQLYENHSPMLGDPRQRIVEEFDLEALYERTYEALSS